FALGLPRMISGSTARLFRACPSPNTDVQAIGGRSLGGTVPVMRSALYEPSCLGILRAAAAPLLHISFVQPGLPLVGFPLEIATNRLVAPYARVRRSRELEIRFPGTCPVTGGPGPVRILMPKYPGAPRPRCGVCLRTPARRRFPPSHIFLLVGTCP